MRIRIDMTTRGDVVDKVCTEFKAQFQDLVVVKTIDDELGIKHDALIQLMRVANDILNDVIEKHVPKSMLEEVNSSE